VEQAVHFVAAALRTTVMASCPVKEGVLLEAVLHHLNNEK
jgi:hypothetical protein